MLPVADVDLHGFEAAQRVASAITRSYRTRHGLRVVEEVLTWDGHPPEVRQAMIDNIIRLREQGLDVIED